MNSKLIVSDYDGTYNQKIKGEIGANNRQVREFMSDNNLFAIVSGRNYNSLNNELKNFKIPYNYMLCADGNFLFDSTNSLVWFKAIDTLKLNILKKYIKYFDSVTMKNPYGEITLNKPCELELVYNNTELRNFFYKIIINELKMSYYHDPDNPLLLHLFGDNRNRLLAIEYLRQLHSISKENVYVIGDGYNDVPMINEYNGYTSISAKLDIKILSNGSYNSVNEFIKRVRSR